MIDTEGEPVDDNDTPPPLTTNLMSSIDYPSPLLSDNNDNELQNNNGNLLHFEFSLPSEDVVGHIIRGLLDESDDEDQFWINGVIDKCTAKVISATIGRASQQAGITVGTNENNRRNKEFYIIHGIVLLMYLQRSMESILVGSGTFSRCP